MLCVVQPGDWEDEDAWKRASPALGDFLFESFLRAEHRKAAASPARQNTFRNLYLNEWTQQATRWIDMKLWDENADLVVEPDLVNQSCYGGLDLASVSDLTAWVLAFPKDDDSVEFLARFFCPESQLDTGRHGALYRQWVSEGLLTATPGNATDHAFVRDAIIRDAERFDLRALNIDYLFQGGQLAGELIEYGLPVEAFRQGHLSYALPMKEFERRLLDRQLHHGGTRSCGGWPTTSWSDRTQRAT